VIPTMLSQFKITKAYSKQHIVKLLQLRNQYPCTIAKQKYQYNDFERDCLNNKFSATDWLMISKTGLLPISILKEKKEVIFNAMIRLAEPKKTQELREALNQNTNLGKVFRARRGVLSTHQNSGMLSLIKTALALQNLKDPAVIERENNARLKKTITAIISGALVAVMIGGFTMAAGFPPLAFALFATAATLIGACLIGWIGYGAYKTISRLFPEKPDETSNPAATDSPPDRESSIATLTKSQAITQAPSHASPAGPFFRKADDPQGRSSPTQEADINPYDELKNDSEPQVLDEEETKKRDTPKL
jgi:hypothetical protein